MGEIIVKNAVRREKGFMYYIDGQGNLCRAKMNSGGRPRKEEIGKKSN